MTPDYTYLVTPLTNQRATDFLKVVRIEDWLEMEEATGLRPGTVLRLAIADQSFVNLSLNRLNADNDPLAIVGGTLINGQLNAYLMVTQYLKLPDMVFLRRNLDAALHTLKTLLGCPEKTEVVCDVWDVNEAHVKWCLGAGFYPTGNIRKAPNTGNFLEMIYTCVPQPS